MRSNSPPAGTRQSPSSQSHRELALPQPTSEQRPVFPSPETRSLQEHQLHQQLAPPRRHVTPPLHSPSIISFDAIRWQEQGVGEASSVFSRFLSGQMIGIKEEPSESFDDRREAPNKEDEDDAFRAPKSRRTSTTTQPERCLLQRQLQHQLQQPLDSRLLPQRLPFRDRTTSTGPKSPESVNFNQHQNQTTSSDLLVGGRNVNSSAASPVDVSATPMEAAAILVEAVVNRNDDDVDPEIDNYGHKKFHALRRISNGSQNGRSNNGVGSDGNAGGEDNVGRGGGNGGEEENGGCKSIVGAEEGSMRKGVDEPDSSGGNANEMTARKREDDHSK